MADHNKIVFSGKVFKPEVKTFGDKIKFKFSLAIDCSYKPKDSDWVNKTIWKDVEMWGRQAETWQNIQEREKVIIEGSLDIREWEHEGKKYRNEFIVPNKISILEVKQKSESAQTATTSDFHDPYNSVETTGIDDDKFQIYVKRDSDGNKMRDASTGLYIIDDATSVPF